MVRGGRTAHLALGAGLVLALIASSCGRSEYRYVNNSSERAFFKVPSDWTVYRIKSQKPDDRPQPQDLGQQQPWHVVFDSAPQPDETHANDTKPDHVVGQALILPLSARQGDAVSTKDLRGFFLDSDPLDLVDQGSSDVELVSFEPITTKNGMRGSRVVVNVKEGEGWTTYDQTSLLDGKASRAYFFDVRCESSCFKANKAKINQIVESWQVRK